MLTRKFTFDEMERNLIIGWGELGRSVARYWKKYNEQYFEDRLQPLPMFLTPVTPYGRFVGWTCTMQDITHICLCAPSIGTILVADKGVLLHEMVHQFLHDNGEYSKHNGEPWRREIMRLNKLLTKKEIWAGASTVIRVKGKSKRINKPHPATGIASLRQGQIARWPHSVGIKLGKFRTTRSAV
jgi:hypothetical protein